MGLCLADSSEYIVKRGEIIAVIDTAATALHAILICVFLEGEN